MNFQKIPPVENSKEMLDLAFKKARERGQQRKLDWGWMDKIKKKESLKLDVISSTITQRLDAIYKSMPETEDLNSFYIQLFRLNLHVAQFRRARNNLQWASRKIR